MASSSSSSGFYAPSLTSWAYSTLIHGYPSEGNKLKELYTTFYTKKNEAEKASDDQKKYRESTVAYRIYKDTLRRNIKLETVLSADLQEGREMEEDRFFRGPVTLAGCQKRLETCQKLLTNVQEMRRLHKEALTNRGADYTQLEQVVEESLALARSSLEAAQRSPSGYASSTQPYRLYKRAAKELMQVMEHQCRKYDGLYGVKMKAYSRCKKQLKEMRALRHRIKPSLDHRTDYFGVKDGSGATVYFKPIVRHSRGPEAAKVVSEYWIKFVRREIDCLLFDDQGMLQGTRNELSDLERSSFGIYPEVDGRDYIVLEHRQLNPSPRPPIAPRFPSDYGYNGYELSGRSLATRRSARWPVKKDDSKKRAAELLRGVEDARFWQEYPGMFVPPEWNTPRHLIDFHFSNSFDVRGDRVFDLRFKRKTIPTPPRSSASPSRPSRSDR